MEQELKQLEEEEKRKKAALERAPPPASPRLSAEDLLKREEETLRMAAQKRVEEREKERKEALAKEEERKKREKEMHMVKEVSGQRKAFNPFLSMDKKKQEEEEAMRKRYADRLKQRESGGGSVSYDEDERERQRQRQAEREEEEAKRKRLLEEEEERRKKLREFELEQAKQRRAALGEVSPRDALESQRPRNPNPGLTTENIADSPNGPGSGITTTGGGLSPAAGKYPRSASAIVRSSVDPCMVCGKQVYFSDKLSVEGKLVHKFCFRCAHCNGTLKLGTFAALEGRYYCKPHFKQLFKTKGNYSSGFGSPTPVQRWEQSQSPKTETGS